MEVGDQDLNVSLNQSVLGYLHGSEPSRYFCDHHIEKQFRGTEKKPPFYPEYSMDKIEFTLDKDYVQMFKEYYICT